MTSALFRKQMQELGVWFFVNKKTGLRRSRGGIVGMGVLYAALCLFLCAVFFGVGWLYYALMAMLAILFGVFGSVFNTYASLYCAKDN